MLFDVATSGKRFWIPEFSDRATGARRCAARPAAPSWLKAVPFAALALAACPAAAQQAPSPGFDPRQTEKRFDDLQSEQLRTRPPVRLPRLAGAPAPVDTRPLFVLRAVSVEGARALPAEEVVTAYQPYLGKKISQADLAAIAAAISDRYRAAGYHLSRAIVPPQDIHGGRIRIKVIEGSITEVALNGDNIERFGVGRMFEAVRAERPARLATLERQLLLVNDRPGVRVVDTALEEIGTASGRFRLVVFLKTWQVFTSFGLDNLGSSAVGPWQAYATGAFNSYLAPGDTMAVNLSTTANDPRELAFGRISYDVPVGTDGFRIGGSALSSEVKPGDVRRDVADRTHTESFEVRAGFVPIQSQLATLSLTVAAGLSNVSEVDVLGPFYHDHIRTVSLTADYRLRDNFGGTNYLTLVGRQGLDVFGASQADDPFLSRDGASPTFSVFDGWFTRYQALTDNWSLKIAAAGQVASTALFTSQQFYLGGAAFGRGYGNAEVSGDNGAAGTLELRFDQGVNAQYLKSYQLYAFVDTGTVWNVGFNIGDGASLTSAGGGIRLFLWGDLRADIGVAVPLTYRAADNVGRSPRLLFSLSNSFQLCPDRTQMHCL